MPTPNLGEHEITMGRRRRGRELVVFGPSIANEGLVVWHSCTGSLTYLPSPRSLAKSTHGRGHSARPLPWQLCRGVLTFFPCPPRAGPHQAVHAPAPARSRPTYPSGDDMRHCGRAVPTDVLMFTIGVVARMVNSMPATDHELNDDSRTKVMAVAWLQAFS